VTKRLKLKFTTILVNPCPLKLKVAEAFFWEGFDCLGKAGSGQGGIGKKELCIQVMQYPKDQEAYSAHDY
jgi:hypothetical protein